MIPVRFVVAGGAVVGVVTGIAGAWEEGLTLAASGYGKGDGGCEVSQKVEDEDDGDDEEEVEE